MSTFVGRISKEPEADKAEFATAPEPAADKTRAELVEEAEALGIEVPPKATKDQIRKLIEDAPVM